MKIPPLGVVPCGRTDMMKPLVDFRNFANAPKISPPCSLLNGLKRSHENNSLCYSHRSNGL